MWHSSEVWLLLLTMELLKILLFVGLIGDFVILSNSLDLSGPGEQIAL